MGIIESLLKKTDKAVVDEENEKEKEKVALENEVNQVFDAIMMYVSNDNVAAQFSQYSRGLVTKQDLLNNMLEYLNHNCKQSKEAITKGIELFSEFEWGYYVLKGYIDNKEVTDITVLNEHRIFYKKADGSRYRAPEKFRSLEELNKFLDLLTTRHGKSISNANALQMFVDETNPDWYLRVDIATGYVTYGDVARLHIRKHPRQKYMPEDLVNNGTLTREQMNYIMDKVGKKESFLVCGGNGQGKTTFINAIIEGLPMDCSVVCLQDANEIHMDEDRQFSSMHPVTKTSSGGIEYTKMECTRYCLRSDVDVFINGEITGEDALDFLLTAHNGATCYASVHSESMQDAFIRIADYAKRKIDYSMAEIQYMLKNLKNVVMIANKHVVSIGRAYWNEDTRTVDVKEVEV